MRPVILGMNNTLSTRPEHALWPAPVGCTGHRLLCLLRRRLPDVGERDYLRAFDRRNLLIGPWDRRRAEEAARDLPSLLTGRTVVALGDEVRGALGLRKVLFQEQTMGFATWIAMPHPSGLNHWYNVEANCDQTARLLEELYLEGRDG